MNEGWIDEVKEKFLVPCNACAANLNVCMCPGRAAFRTILAQMVFELENSWKNEADAWNRGYDVAKKQYRKT